MKQNIAFFQRLFVYGLFVALLLSQASCATPYRIRDDIDKRLLTVENLGKHEIDIGISGSKVTLNGYVGSYDAKQRVVDAVKSIEGVTEVKDNLAVS